MTTPASGAISLSNINTEVGAASDANRSLAWVRDNTKDGQKNLAGIYSRGWYQRNVDGNCNNGNCTSNCNCGGQCNCACNSVYWNGSGWSSGQCACTNCNCANCLACSTINCANCDTRPWLQGNCNCACTYNCATTGTVSYNCSNCNCNCNCDCDCTACG